MLIRKSLLILFFLSSLPALASTPLTYSPIPENAQATNADRQLAREVHQTLRDLRNNRPNSAQVQRVVTNSQRSQAFSGLRPLFQLIHGASQIGKNTSRFYSACDHDVINEHQVAMAPIEERIISDLHSFCRHLYFTFIRQGIIASTLDGPALNYFRANVLHALQGEHAALFESVLPRLISANSSQAAVLNDLIENILIESSISPSANLLKIITPSKRLTSYIQGQNTFDTQASRYFRLQAREMIAETRRHIEQNNVKEANTSLAHLAAFFYQNLEYIGQQFAWINMNSLARRFIYQKQLESAKIAYGYSLSLSSEAQLDEARFHLVWVDILSGNMQNAYGTIKELNLLDSMEEHGSKLKYWIARTLDRVGHRSTASHIYREIAESDPMSFYSILSLRELTGNRGNGATIAHSNLNPQRVPTSESERKEILLSEQYQQSLSRLNLWLELDLDQYSFFEIGHLFTARERGGISNAQDWTEEEFTQGMNRQLAKFFNGKDKYLHTFRILNASIQNKTMPVDVNVLELLYPTRYLEDIKRIDSEIDPVLILALIRQESAFNPTARSSAGARGLMQIMPATGRSLQRNLRVAQLFNTETNLRLGIRYFKRLANTYDGNLIYALSAYNAGQGNVRSWQRDVFIFGDDPLVQIEMIPFRETRKYVKLIYRNIYFYNLLRDRSLLDSPLEQTLQIGFYSGDSATI